MEAPGKLPNMVLKLKLKSTGNNDALDLDVPTVHRANIHGDLSKWTGCNGNDYWQFCGFRTNRDITAVNLGICGPPEGGHYRIRMKIVEDSGAPNSDGTTLGETEALAYAQGGRDCVYYVPFKEPVQLKADTWYRAYVYMTEGPPHTLFGLQGRTSIDVPVPDTCRGSSVHFDFRFHDGQPYSIGFLV